MTLRRTPSAFVSAFSLVEVTLALGLVSFVLVALLGLFGVALKSGRSSSAGTLLPQIVQQVSGMVEVAAPPTPGVETKYYFDDTGVKVAAAANATYTVAVTARLPDEASEIAFLGGRLLLMTMKVTYPGGEKTVCRTMTL